MRFKECDEMPTIFPTIPPYRDFTVSPPVIPSLYWNVYSQEQRIKAICKELKKCIEYAEACGKETNEIAKAIEDIYDGKLDPVIVAVVEEWFAENEPEIMDDISDLQDAVTALQNLFPIHASDIDTGAVTSSKILDFAVTTNKIADDAITTAKIADDAITASKIADNAVEYSALDTGIQDMLDEIPAFKNRSFQNKNIICIGDSFGRGTGAGDGGSPNDKGWPYYVNAFLHPNFFLNVSNSAAGFVRAGHTAPYSGMNFLQQATYAHNNELGAMSDEDIDIIIIGGGINDYNQSDTRTGAYDTIRGIHALFPNAQIYYFPLAAGDQVMDEEHYSTLAGECYGCADGGAQVFNTSMWWLYPYQQRCSYGDGTHPNQQGYHFIGSFICASLSGSYLTDSIYYGSSYAMDGLVIDGDATNVSFHAQAANNAAWFGGIIKRTGTGNLAVLPSYCRPQYSTQLIAYAYANGSHQGPARIYINATTGVISFYAMTDSAQYNATLEYTIYIPVQYCPFGHMV